MKHPPKYYGTLEESKEQCFCKKNRGTVWKWTPRVQGCNMSEHAHTKCFRRLWAGER